MNNGDSPMSSRSISRIGSRCSSSVNTSRERIDASPGCCNWRDCDTVRRSKRGLDKSQLLRLATGDWIQLHGVLLIAGPTSTGKSWLACALGHSACRHGYLVRYLSFLLLLPELAIARNGGTYSKVLAQLGKVDLLILDDWGLAPIGDRERRDLVEMIEDLTGRRATLLTSQVPVEHWHEGVGDATFGDAIMDRLVHHAHRITLTGGSLRKLGAGAATDPV